MAESREGNVILAPGYAKGDEVTPSEILYSTVGLFQKGGALAPNKGVLKAGQLMKFNATTKFYEPVAVDGGETEVSCILRNAVDTSGKPKLGNLVFGGILDTTRMPVMGWATVATTLNGTYNADRGFLKF